MLSVAQIADRLHASCRTVRVLIRRGELAAVKINKRYRVSESAYRDFLRRSAVGRPLHPEYREWELN